MGVSTDILIARRKAEAEAREAERRAEAGEAAETEAEEAFGPDDCDCDEPCGECE